MTPGRLDELIERFGRVRVCVLGDFFLDEYLEIDAALAEPSLETGRTAHQVVRVRTSPGAAGTVASNLAALGAGAMHAVGFTGDDGAGYDLARGLGSLGCSTERLFRVADRVTSVYLKPRDTAVPGLDGEFERLDIKNRTETPAPLVRRIMAALDDLLPSLDAVVVVDQVTEDDCGVVTSEVRGYLSDRARRYPDVVFFAESRKNVLRFRDLVIKPNQHEVLGIDKPPPGLETDIGDLKRAVAGLRERTNAPVCATLGPRGILVSDPEPTVVRGVRVSGPTDPTGAGDTVAAGMTLALASGASLVEAALIGNLAAAVTVRKLDTCGTCTPGELRACLDEWEGRV